MHKAVLTQVSQLHSRRLINRLTQPTSPSRQRAVFTVAISAGLCLLASGLSLPAMGQSADALAAPAATSISTPEAALASSAAAPETIVRWTASLPEAAGKTVEMRFDLFENQAGGVSLWGETQRVTVGADGKYTVLLGATTPEGLPATLFAVGEARWLEAKLAGNNSDSSSSAGASPRSLLAAAPYAFMSADSANLGGRAASDYITRDELQSVNSAKSTSPAFTPLTSGTVTGTGTANYLPLWTGALTQGNSLIYQSASGLLGINTLAPSTTLDVNGTLAARADLREQTLNVATTASGQSSPYVEMIGSTYNSTAAASQPVTFAFREQPLLNNTATPTGGLYLLYGEGSSALTPTATGLSFNSNGTINFAPGQGFSMNSLTAATSTAAVNSGNLFFRSSAWSSTTSAAVTQTFNWKVVASGNDTASPTGNLQLFTGSGPGSGAGSSADPTATGLSIAPTGVITFAPGQNFASGITSVTGTSPITASLSGSLLTVGVNLPTLTSDILPSLETTLNSKYARLSGGNIFTSYLEAYQTSGPGNAALLGWGSSGSVGAFGDSDTGYGVQGESTSGHGVYSQVTSPVAGSSGVLGFTGTTFSTTYSSEAGIADAGVWADSSAAGSGVPVSLFATGDDVYAGAFITNGQDFPAFFADNNKGTAIEAQAAAGYGVSASTGSGTGVYGSTSSGGNGVEGISTSLGEQEAGVVGIGNTFSTVGGSYNIYSGVWGDTGTSSTTVAPAWAIGVLGTADDSHAGVFLNNSSGWSTLFTENYSTGGTGLFKTFMASTPTGTCGIGGNGDLSCTGQVKALVSAGNGTRTVETYSVQSPENWMEDFGSGQVERGAAVVRIDPAFAETVTGDASYHVFLTPNGDSKGLYVINKTATSFEVRESGGGTSSLTFDYRIVAKRRGFEAQRLTDVTERFNAEQKAATMNRSTGTRAYNPMAKHTPKGLELAPKTPTRKITPGVSPRPTTPHSATVVANGGTKG